MDKPYRPEQFFNPDAFHRTAFTLEFPPYQFREMMVGVCSAGCGCEVRRAFMGDPDADLVWCRRCQAYGLFRWRILR